MKTTNNFEAGTKVQVLTDKGIFEGTITDYWRETTTNQFLVNFTYNECIKCSLNFSKKTGKPYGSSPMKNKIIKVIL